MTIRDRVIYGANTLLGNYVKGSQEVYEIWRDVCDPTWSDSQVRLFARDEEWCGGFALDALRIGGATQAHWLMGKGFIGPLGLRPTHSPQPGDIAVKEHPFSHHMVVEYWNSPTDWGDLAGNTPNAARHHHTSSDGITFYSIQPLLDAAEKT